MRDGALFRHGYFESLRTDHARELIERIMTGLKNQVGFEATTTGGYNAKGNFTMDDGWI